MLSIESERVCLLSWLINHDYEFTGTDIASCNFLLTRQLQVQIGGAHNLISILTNLTSFFAQSWILNLTPNPIPIAINSLSTDTYKINRNKNIWFSWNSLRLNIELAELVLLIPSNQLGFVLIWIWRLNSSRNTWLLLLPFALYTKRAANDRLKADQCDARAANRQTSEWDLQRVGKNKIDESARIMILFMAKQRQHLVLCCQLQDCRTSDSIGIAISRRHLHDNVLRTQ